VALRCVRAGPFSLLLNSWCHPIGAKTIDTRALHDRDESCTCAHVLLCVCVHVHACIGVLVCVFERATGLSHGIWLLTLQVKRKCCLIILLRQYCRQCRADPNAALQVARSGGVDAAVAVLTATGGAESLGLLWTLRSPLVDLLLARPSSPSIASHFLTLTADVWGAVGVQEPMCVPLLL